MKKIINYKIPMVSIVIIRHAENKNIINTLNSIKNQTYRKVEILIGDCCIDEDTELSSYLNNHKNIYYDKYETIDKALDYLTDKAVGYYMNVILSEVRFLDHRLEKMMNIILESENVVFVLSGNRYLGNENITATNVIGEIKDFVSGRLITKNSVGELLARYKVNFLNQCSGSIFKSSLKDIFTNNYKNDYFTMWNNFLTFGHGFYLKEQLIASYENQEQLFTYSERSSKESWLYYNMLDSMGKFEGKEILLKQWGESLFYAIAEDIALYKCEKKKDFCYQLPFELSQIYKVTRENEKLMIPNTASSALKSLDLEYCKEDIDSNKVLFSCVTVYHLFTAAILSELYYKDKKKILLLSNLIDSAEKLYEKLKESNMWDQVILFDEKIGLDNHSKEEYKEIFLQCGTLHYFTFGTPLNESIISLINPNTKMILTDEGLMTYFINEFLPGYITNRGLSARQIKLDFVDEVWVYNKELLISKFNVPIKEIDMPEREELKAIVNKLNVLFDYDLDTLDEGIIFFDQYFMHSELFSEENEKAILSAILDASGNRNIYVKKHPRVDDSKYNGTDIKVMKYSDLPWELLRLNEIISDTIKPRIYITYFSTAILTDFMIGKKYSKEENNYILMEKLMSDFGPNEDLKFLYEVIDKIQVNYNKEFYFPNSVNELSRILEQIK